MPTVDVGRGPLPAQFTRTERILRLITVGPQNSATMADDYCGRSWPAPRLEASARQPTLSTTGTNRCGRAGTSAHTLARQAPVSPVRGVRWTIAAGSSSTQGAAEPAEWPCLHPRRPPRVARWTPREPGSPNPSASTLSHSSTRARMPSSPSTFGGASCTPARGSSSCSAGHPRSCSENRLNASCRRASATDTPPIGPSIASTRRPGRWPVGWD